MSSSGHDEAFTATPPPNYPPRGSRSLFGKLRDFFQSGLQVHYVAGLTYVRNAPDLWLLAALGTVPLFAATFQHPNYRTAAVAFAFAFIWARLFRDAQVLPELKPHWLPTVAVTLPVIISIPFFTFMSLRIPGHQSWMDWAKGTHFFVSSYFVCIFFLGLPQECFKLAPSLLYMAWKGTAATASDLLAIGVCAGLGFGAAIFALAPDHPITNMGVGDHSLALFVSPFLNAALGGFVSCHLGFARRRFWPSVAYTLFGLVAAALLFGLFLWFLRIHVLVSAIIAAIVAFLFFGLARVVVATSSLQVVNEPDVISF